MTAMSTMKATVSRNGRSLPSTASSVTTTVPGGKPIPPHVPILHLYVLTTTITTTITPTTTTTTTVPTGKPIPPHVPTLHGNSQLFLIHILRLS